MKKGPLAINIRRLRQAKGMIQQQLADACDLTVQAIKNFESGQTEGSTKTREAIARALGVTVAELFLPYSEPAVETGVTVDELCDVVRAYAKAPRSSRELAKMVLVGQTDLNDALARLTQLQSKAKPKAP